MNAKSIVWSVIVAAACLLAQPARAEETGFRSIVDIGCHEDKGTCFVKLDGSAFGGAQNCRVGASTEVRWDDADQANGKRTFAALYGAFLAGKQVNLEVSGCTSQQYVAVAWYHIHP